MITLVKQLLCMCVTEVCHCDYRGVGWDPGSIAESAYIEEAEDYET